jgi:hypothetical protein
MLYEIKVLKAPWPKGAKVGDVIDMPFLPVWAEGKCSVALDGAKADFTLDRSDVVEGGGAGTALPSVDAINAQVADLQRQLNETEGRASGLSDTVGRLLDELKEGVSEALVTEKKLADVEAAKAALLEDKAAAEDEIKQLREKLAAAESAVAAVKPKGNGK